VTLSLTHWSLITDHSLSHFWFLTLKSNPTDLWPLRHLIRVMKRHDLTQKNLPTNVPPLGNPRDLWPLKHLIRVIRRHDLIQKDKYKDNFGDFGHVRHWLKFWQLRTWIPDNNCYLTIKSDSGQQGWSPRPAPWKNRLPRPAPQKAGLAPPCPVEIDKTHGTQRGKTECRLHWYSFPFRLKIMPQRNKSKKIFSFDFVNGLWLSSAQKYILNIARIAKLP